MTTAIAPTLIQDAPDGPGSLTPADDGKFMMWDGQQKRMIMASVRMGSGGINVLRGGANVDLAISTAIATHVAAADPHTGYLLATGARTGASSQSQTFTNGIVGPSWKPAADSTTALQMQNASAVAIVTVDTTNRRVGINDAPSAALHISTEETSVSFFDIYNASLTSVPIIQRAARGTKASPTAVQSGDTLFGFAGRGYGATGFSSGARATISGIAAENWTDTEQGAHLRFQVTQIGTTSVTEKMRIRDTGFVGLGTTVPVGHLSIAGNATAAAWGTAGIILEMRAATFTDSSTAGSGTATNAVANSFAVATFAASNSSVTMTNAATVYIANAPAAGTNVTLTNAYALWVDNGVSRLDGQLQLPASTTLASSVRIPHGSAPSSPVDGDVWTTTAGLFVRINGATVGPLS